MLAGELIRVVVSCAPEPRRDRPTPIPARRRSRDFLKMVTPRYKPRGLCVQHANKWSRNFCALAIVVLGSAARRQSWPSLFWRGGGNQFLEVRIEHWIQP